MIMFKVGDRVFDIREGWGVVWSINDTVNVEFEGGNLHNYTLDGRDYADTPIILYHHDYTPTSEVKQTFDSGYIEDSEVLTKRERFAAMAMQGLLSGNDPDYTNDFRLVVQVSVSLADDLIKALKHE